MLHRLHIELVKLQRHFIKHDDRIRVLLEGRDSAGKDHGKDKSLLHADPDITFRYMSEYLENGMVAA